MTLYLEQAETASPLQDSSANEYGLKRDSTFNVMCYSLRQDGIEPMPNRMLEIPCRFTYNQLQDTIDAKYNLPVQLQYIDDDQQDILVDSDLVLKRAI